MDSRKVEDAKENCTMVSFGRQKVRCEDGLPGMRAMVTSQTEGRDRQGCRRVGRCHLVTCGQFFIRVSAFSVKEEIGSSAESKNGEKLLKV